MLNYVDWEIAEWFRHKPKLYFSLLTTGACGRRARLPDCLVNGDEGLSTFSFVCWLMKQVALPSGVPTSVCCCRLCWVVMCGKPSVWSYSCTMSLWSCSPPTPHPNSPSSPWRGLTSSDPACHLRVTRTSPRTLTSCLMRLLCPTHASQASIWTCCVPSLTSLYSLWLVSIA